MGLSALQMDGFSERGKYPKSHERQRHLTQSRGDTEGEKRIIRVEPATSVAIIRAMTRD
jgi:hypothetical protein